MAAWFAITVPTVAYEQKLKLQQRADDNVDDNKQVDEPITPALAHQGKFPYIIWQVGISLLLHLVDFPKTLDSPVVKDFERSEGDEENDVNTPIAQVYNVFSFEHNSGLYFALWFIARLKTIYRLLRELSSSLGSTTLSGVWQATITIIRWARLQA